MSSKHICREEVQRLESLSHTRNFLAQRLGFDEQMRVLSEFPLVLIVNVGQEGKENVVEGLSFPRLFAR